MRGRLETQRKEMLRIEGSAKVQIADNEALLGLVLSFYLVGFNSGLTLGANVNSSYSSSEKRKRKRSQVRLVLWALFWLRFRQLMTVMSYPFIQKLEDKEQTLTRLYNNIEQELLAAEDDR